MSRKAPAPPMPPEEYELIVQAAQEGDPSIAVSYFTTTPAGPGFVFDHNFNPPWQVDFCMGDKPKRFVIGGYGAGKTKTVVMSFLYWALTVNDFKAIYAAPTNAQAENAFSMLTNAALNSPLDRYLTPNQRPYYRAFISYTRPDGVEHRASIAFVNMTDGVRWVLSMEADWVHLDEAFVLKAADLEEAVRSLGSRARGVRSTGKPRFGYFSITTNPYENTYGWYLWEVARNNPEAWWTRTVTTFANQNITDEQIQNMVDLVGGDSKSVMQFLLGQRMLTEGRFFRGYDVENCMFAADEDGVKIERDPTFGVYLYDREQQGGTVYVAGVDLGTGAPPHRNSPAAIVVGLRTNAQTPHAELVHFWWGDGRIARAVVDEVEYILRKYAPLHVYIDASGSQMGQYLTIVDELTRRGIERPQTVPVNFQSAKGPMVYALRSVLASGLLRIPDVLAGLKEQLLIYPGPDDDKNIPQDLVMALAMTAPDVWSMLAPGLKEEDEGGVVISHVNRRVSPISPRRLERGRPIKVPDGPPKIVVEDFSIKRP